MGGTRWYQHGQCHEGPKGTEGPETLGFEGEEPRSCGLYGSFG